MNTLSAKWTPDDIIVPVVRPSFVASPSVPRPQDARSAQAYALLDTLCYGPEDPTGRVTSDRAAMIAVAVTRRICDLAILHRPKLWDRIYPYLVSDEFDGNLCDKGNFVAHCFVTSALLDIKVRKGYGIDETFALACDDLDNDIPNPHSMQARIERRKMMLIRLIMRGLKRQGKL